MLDIYWFLKWKLSITQSNVKQVAYTTQGKVFIPIGVVYNDWVATIVLSFYCTCKVWKYWWDPLMWIPFPGRPKRRAASERQEPHDPAYLRALNSSSDSDQENNTHRGRRRATDWANLQGIISDDADSGWQWTVPLASVQSSLGYEHYFSFVQIEFCDWFFINYFDTKYF